MRINVHVKPTAKEVLVEKLDDVIFKVNVKEPPVEGRANRAVCEALADYFSVSLSKVRIISGFTSRQKIIEIETGL